MIKALPGFVLITFFASTVLSQSESQTSSFLNKGFQKTTAELKALGEKVLPQTNDCPSGGIKVQQGVSSVEDTLFSTSRTVESLMQSLQASANQKRAETANCGRCQQHNLVSAIASIAPVRTVSRSECDGRPTEVFRVKVQSKSEIKKFSENLLKARSPEGKKLLAGCPDPCAYYINTAETAVADGTNVTMVVQCGSPRQDSIFSAVYKYNASVVHQWSCSK